MSLENSLVLGRYRVLWLVDQKKLSKSYIARDETEESFGAPVVVRQFMHDLGDQDAPSVHALRDELAGLSHLRHAGVVSLLDHGIVEDRLITASVHTPGANLSLLCEYFAHRQRPFPPHLAVYVVRRLLQTLHHCHTREPRSFVHGRITLGCIHVPASGEPQLMDFGLASLEDVAVEAESQLSFFQTRMSFAAPEVTRGETPTARGDTYSLALLLYRMLAGSNPFRGRSIPETLQRVLQLTPAPLVMPEWEHCAQMNAILERALSKDPALRHQSCLELSDELSNLQVGTYDALAESLATLVRSNSSGDWRQIARLTRAAGKSQPPRELRGSQRLAGMLESAPAFVSGLLTAQPVSASEHTARAQREQTRAKRRRSRRLAMLPTVLLPAAAIILGLFLGRLGGAGATAGKPPAATTAAAAAPPGAPAGAGNADPLVSESVASLQAHVRECLDPKEGRELGSKVELEFGAAGQLAEVRLWPSALAETRLGACMLQRVWDTGVTAPAAMSLVIPIADER